MKRFLLIPVALAALLTGQSPEPRTRFRVKYVAESGVYIDGGRNAGLAEKMKLTVRREGGRPEGEAATEIADLEITAVAANSAACAIRNAQSDIAPGDWAYLSPVDVENMKAMKPQGSRQYAQVVAFTEDDVMEEEARESVPRPPSPEVNRARGRVGFEYNSIRDVFSSSQLGFVFRGDLARIGGTFWSLSGYWRGRLNSRQTGSRAETMTDLLNRTYHLTLSYNNPLSPWVAGFGRLYLPWATSLDTIDGGYFGRRFGKRFTAGMFAGSTPDPTSWNYNPNRQLAGTFVHHSAGDFESLHVSSTAGVALSRIRWRPERQFLFFENGLFYKRNVSVYHNLEMDQTKGAQGTAGRRAEVSRSFLTLRLQPARILSLDFSHNYFRNLPTFDPRLVGTGLLDRLLFEGASAGFRLELPLRSALYASLGRSSRTGDARRSLNQMYGFSKDDLFGSGVRADFRYSKFDSSFGRGTYRTLSLSREIRECLRLEIQAGDQYYASAFSEQNRSRYINATTDWSFAKSYFLGGGYSVYRSRVQNYIQTYVNLGYRF
jgi:hypothetical protein